MKRERITELIAFNLLRLIGWSVVAVFALIIYFLASRGLSVVGFGFLTQWPLDSMTKGGIYPALVGTFYLTAGAILIALPLGILSAVHLTEDSQNEPVLRVILLIIN